MKTKASPLAYFVASAILTPSFVAGVVIFAALALILFLTALAAFVVASPAIPFVVYKLRKGNKTFGTFPKGTISEPVPES